MYRDTFKILGQIFSAACGVDESVDGFGDEVGKFRSAIEECRKLNGWFYPEFVRMQLMSLSEMLSEESLGRFCGRYNTGTVRDKKVKVIAAGNIPLVCFHDMMCVIMSGCVLVLKPSSKDNLLPRLVSETLKKINPDLTDRIIIEDGAPEKFDAIIATGSNNSSRYFDYYFAKYPHIIRRGRNSVAVLSGNETAEDYAALADDIFAFYGLGCRSVSKIYVPMDYNYSDFFGGIIQKSDVMRNPKYSDNYTYNKAIYLMSEQPILDNNFVLLKEDTGLNSPIGVVFAERYQDLESLSEMLRNMKDSLQCVVSNAEIPGVETVRFGEAQHPDILDFADGVDTMEFLGRV